ncbi:MAG TPA: response regulator transcription factor [Phycisphaerae bacterium]|jgi:two-component system copper resistance phosphate regulon response regulator CusR|nr:response regulator transcription factor [Phycisphaerae bacterium]HOB75568.1 response regulator transcription factor [Phycisphaerae bacterium]HOJ55162.1 response regulator transcription factor [Phycisphaerae bacterium]HOL27364.1 response regulator transcription factor [Phycisphaerae bacterium]HPP20696.1 response regulator transcription factor [Phycisphaerae bacterium]
MRVLVIEDNPKIASLIEEGFKAQGYAVDKVESGHEGENKAAEQHYDTIILDIMLPDQDGVQVCRNLRRRGVSTPVLMLTALSTTLDKVAGLDAGADDYLTKPFEFDELLARVRALLRRGEAQEAAVLRFEDLEMDLVHRTVTRAGQKIKLTTKEFALLEYLMRNPERVLSRASIGEHVWDMDFDNDSNVIDVYISMLRRKIDRAFSHPLIHTVIGTGYVLSATDPNQ